MTEFVTKDLHCAFVKHCLAQVDIINRKIHESYVIVFDNYYYLQDYYNLIVKYKIETNKDILFSGQCKVQPIPDDTIEDKYFISKYNEIIKTITLIKNLSKVLNRYSYLSKIPLHIYRIIIVSTNFELSLSLLKGDTVIYPKIGGLRIIRIPYDSTKPDWGQSYKFKKYLQEQGLTVKDKENVNGKAWLVDNGLNRDDFCILRWNKGKSKLHNKEPYHLFASSRCNLHEKANPILIDFDTVFNMTKTGLFDKIVYLYRNYYDYVTNTFPFVGNKND